MSKYDDKKIEKLLQNEGIVRNRLKVHAFITNAKAFLLVQKEFGSFSKYIWSFVDNKPIVNSIKGFGDVAAKTSLSDTMSKDMLKRGFKFTGSTICYAYMQACGLVNDHFDNCWKKKNSGAKKTA
jgi:DNA-3-methyladenine glycosylase I